MAGFTSVGEGVSMQRICGEGTRWPSRRALLRHAESSSIWIISEQNYLKNETRHTYVVVADVRSG